MALHHFKFNREIFDKDVAELRDQFINDKNHQYIFKGHDTSLNIPIDGLPLYIEKNWGTIKECKDINLPSQKIMVANLRCNDIKNDILQGIESQIQALKNKIKSDKPYEDFGVDANQIFQKACEDYDAATANYDKKVAEERRKELIDNLLNVIGEIFFEQAQLIKKTISIELSHQLVAIKVDPVKIEVLKEKLKKVKESVEEHLKHLIDATRTDNFDFKLNLIDDECKAAIHEQLCSYREKQFSIMVKKIFNRQKRKMEGIVGELFNDIDSNFWPKLTDEQLKSSKEFEDLIKFNLSDVFELDSKAIENQLENLREEFKRELEVILRDKFQDLTHYALKKLHYL